MKIKNITSNITTKEFWVILIFFLGLVAIDLIIFFVILHTGMTIFESIKWLWTLFLEANIVVKGFCLFFHLITIILFVLIIFMLKERYIDNKATRNSIEFIKYIDFKKDKIKVFYPNLSCIKEVYYKDIDFMQIDIILYRSSTEYAMGEWNININAGDKIFSIHNPGVNYSKVFKVIYFSQYMQSFSYNVYSNDDKLQNRLTKSIKDYIDNNYRKHLLNLLITNNEIIFVIILFLTLIVSIIYIINTIK